MADYSDEILALVRKAPTAAISGCLYKRGFRTRAVRDVRALNPANCSFAGPAFTIRYLPQREDLNASTDLGSPDSLLRRAIEEIPPGAVFVMDMREDRHVGGIGDVLAARLVKIGIAGLVADGGMRDVRELREMDLPIFCAGAAAPPGPVELIPVGLQEPVACGGVAVFPGDLVVADEDGVLVVPAHLADEVVTEAAAKEKHDVWTRGQVEAGGEIRGLYPPNQANLEKFQHWLQAEND
jgi:regulator of RNase E activity RraA